MNASHRISDRRHGRQGAVCYHSIDITTTRSPPPTSKTWNGNVPRLTSVNRAESGLLCALLLLPRALRLAWRRRKYGPVNLNLLCWLAPTESMTLLMMLSYI